MLPSRHPPSSPLPVDSFQHCALVLGHPGHELKIFGWMSKYRPRVHVLTDGSGQQGEPRTLSTAALITRVGSEPGEVFGSIRDAEIYRAMLNRDLGLFLRLVDQLSDSLLKHEIDSVAGDAAEGFNPTHDICRALINAAVIKALSLSRRTIANFEFSLTEWEPNSVEPLHDDHCRHWILDDELLARKIAAAEQYAGLKSEVDRALAHRGREYFRLECLRSSSATGLPHFNGAKPVYERWGEQRVADGRYPTVIRFKQHILPIMKTVLNYAGQASLAPPLAGARW